MIPLGWRLSAAQWDLLTEVLRLEGYPAPIQVRSHGRTGAQRGRIRAEVGDELRRLGLLRSGRVDADLEAAMRLLHRPASWLDSVWLSDAAAEQPVRVVAAQGGTVGVCALQQPDHPGATALDVVPAAALAAAVVARLPAHPPGRSPGGWSRPRAARWASARCSSPITLARQHWTSSPQLRWPRRWSPGFQRTRRVAVPQ